MRPDPGLPYQDRAWEITGERGLVKIAVVHDWLVTFAGAEAVLEQILALFPDADLFSLIDFLPESERSRLLGKRARTSVVQHFPFAEEKYRSYLPVMPWAMGRLDLSGYDLVISSSHAVAKGVRVPEGIPHVCYCHTPMRYAWDLKDQYLQSARFGSGIKRRLAEYVLERIRRWDRAAAQKVSRFVANSACVAERIKRSYGRDSEVIYPPVDTEFYTPGGERADYYMAASRMVPYKRMDLIAEAFSAMPDRKLLMIGSGPDLQKVRSKVTSGNIEILGYRSRDELRGYLQKAKAFVFAAEEDFGILPVEAQACGTPVVAYGAGGATETVEDGVTGVFFREQSAESLREAVARLDENYGSFHPGRIRQNAERFGVERFRVEFGAFIEQAIDGPGK